MSELNKNILIAKSDGVDLPILRAYLAGRIAGDCIEKCLKWRKDIIHKYRYYKIDDDGNYTAYPISFLCPLNSGEASSVDSKGLTSSLPSNLIYDKDLLSVQHADIVIANMEDYFEEGLDLSNISHNHMIDTYILKNRFQELREAILDRRENIGTVMEVAWALLLNKPVILIVPERRKEVFEKHPFTKRASVIVTSVEQLIEEKWIQILYKSIAGAIY